MSLLDDAIGATVKMRRCQTCRLVGQLDGPNLAEWEEAAKAVVDGRVQAKALHRAMQTRWPNDAPTSATSLRRHLQECDR